MGIAYSCLRQCLFQLPAETAHYVALKTLKASHRFHLLPTRTYTDANLEVKLMGLTFPNPLGLAAGLDKNGEYIDCLAALGFGFIEVGTVTPRPQAGNPKPRLFRLPHHQALINRMGFNNKGVDYLVAQLKKASYRGILGINIGKNKMTPNDRAIDDYLHCLNKVYPFASYITINISSPNTPGLRQLQQQEALSSLLSQLKAAQSELTQRFQQYKPLVIKLSPDLAAEDLEGIAQALLQYEIDGVIATNTSIHRFAAAQDKLAREEGGLSGQPLARTSLDMIGRLAQLLQGKIPIIGVGGIFSPQDMRAKLEAGASLVQLYTGFIYRGPGILKELIEGLSAESSH